MKATTIKSVGAFVSVAALMGSSFAAVPAIATESASGEVPAAVEQSTRATQAFTPVTADQVQGRFAYSQDAITSNVDISSVFCKAAATLCVSMPEYVADQVDGRILVSGPNSSMTVAVEGIGDDQESSKIVGCSCASNGAGGGAVANAEVSGVDLATLYRMAQA